MSPFCDVIAFDRLGVLCPAAGKSTFVRLLEQESQDWEVVPEPIARWCNVQTDGSDFEVFLHFGTIAPEIAPSPVPLRVLAGDLDEGWLLLCCIRGT